ncbi:MAG TPA: phosphomannomutase/phosphoglucomutase [Actinomycetota bacterium]|nr:phosphomannomutase/phosphoglucomutase [Actinomycetota bacterium]
MHRDLSAIFKAYDVRGTYPDEIDEDAARRIGAALARFCDASRLAVGRDMRTSSEALARAFARGASSVGAEVLDLGLVSTDGLYFASGKLDVPACMVTASHNPGRYNGFKPCRAGAAPIGSESGLKDIQALAEKGEAVAEVSDGRDSDLGEQLDIIGDYSAHCRSFVEVDALKPLKVVVDAGNGMAGLTVPVVFADLPFQLVPLYFELDGTFPNHPASPIEPENLVDLQRAVQETGSDLGIAFDGDADRMFLVDERSNLVSGSTTTALVAERVLKKQPGERIIYNLICSWTVPEVIKENGGEPIRTRVGHSFIKDVMATTGAAFGGEHSGHYYFRDNFRADSGMIAALLVLEALSLAGKPLSELLEPYYRYSASGEINSEVEDQQERLEALAAGYQQGKQDRTDGLTIEFEDWWFNCRPSNTEPLLRLNLEARTEELMKTKRDEVLSLIRDNREG